jgi:DNA polymerase III delta prime subunit
VRLWDLETGVELRRFERHKKGVNTVAALPDGQRALSGSADRTLRLWDLETGAELRRFEVGEMVYSVAPLPDGRRALSGSEDRTVRLWDLETGVELRRFEGHTGAVWSVAVLHDGMGALSGSFDHTLRLWDLEETGDQRLIRLPAADQFASRLATRVQARERFSERRNSWQDSAAVLVWFRPAMIGAPSGGKERLGDEDWVSFVADTEPVAKIGGGARRLREVVRRAALSRLGPNGWRDVRARISDAPREPLQRILDAVLRGDRLDPSKLDRAELDALPTVSRWLAGVVPSLPPDDVVAGVIALTDLLDPLRRLVEHFVGREAELDDLRVYVEEIPPTSTVRRFFGLIGNRVSDLIGRKTLVLYGPPGVGKSTLVARFLLEHAQHGLPFIYIDLDRPSLDPRNPFVLLDEAQRQLALQAPNVRTLATSFSADLEQVIRERATSEASRSASLLTAAVAGFAGLVTAALPQERRLPFVIDTFEDAQAIGSEALFGIARLVQLLIEAHIRIRPVICGRVPPDRQLLQSDPIRVREFEPPEALEFLQQLLNEQHHTTIDARTLQPVVRAVSGTPLALSLAARLIAEHGVDAVPRPGFLGRLLHLTDDAELYSRTLSNLKDPQLHALAKPGLLVRRLTPDILRRVLAEPCGLSVANDGEARELLQKMEDAVSLVEREPDGALKHRQDVRLKMLSSLEREVGADVARHINETAAEFYAPAGPSDPIDFGERLYHLLRLDEIDTASKLWSDLEATQPAVERLRAAVDELRPDARRALKVRLHMPLTSEELSAANQDEWERAVAGVVRASLADGNFEAAAKALSERTERLGDSRLPLLEIEVFSGLQDWRRVIDIARPAAQRAAQRGDPRDAFTLHFAASRASEAMGDRAEALHVLDEAEEQARRSGEVELMVRLAATRRRLTGEQGTTTDEDSPELNVVQSLKASGILDRLGGAALREVAAAFGHIDPTLLRAALYRLGLPEIPAEMMSRLATLLIEQMRRQDSASSLIRATLAGYHEGEPPEDLDDQRAWERWLVEIPRLHLGRAVAELIRGGADSVPGLMEWAQMVLKERVVRDVGGETSQRSAIA